LATIKEKVTISQGPHVVCFRLNSPNVGDIEEFVHVTHFEDTESFVSRKKFEDWKKNEGVKWRHLSQIPYILETTFRKDKALVQAVSKCID